MKRIIKKVCGRAFAILVVGMSLFTACNPEPDESDLFTATGETAADYIKRKSELSSFNYILSRVGLDKNLSAYGTYTCFAPTNEAIAAYIDTLYNDKETVNPHHGMEDHGETLAEGQHAELSWLSDSLCKDIALYHLSASIFTSIDMGGAGIIVSSMLNRPINTSGSIDSIGRVTLNKEAVIIEPDSLVTNGVVHVINRVMPRSNRVIVEEMERMSEFSIFAQALRLTGLADSLVRTKKEIDENDNPWGPTKYDHTNTDKKTVYWGPTECKIAYTIFAEPNDVLAKNGINNIDDLIDYANKVYGNASEWYTYFKEKGQEISTGEDYTNRWNALNMFVAYHILYAGMPENQLVYEPESGKNGTDNYWNFCNGTAPYDYYETMLPGTIMKIWQPNGLSRSTRNARTRALYINRWRPFNTLTDEIGTMGSNAMHAGGKPGVKIRTTLDDPSDPHLNVPMLNGYIHKIEDMLVYDADVPTKVLHERMRFETTTYLYEFINNNIRFASMNTVKGWNGGGSGARVAFPHMVDAPRFFDGVVSYTDNNRFRYNVIAAYNAWQSNTFQGWGYYDFAVKLPPLPTGTYEFRIFFTPMGHGSMMQYYLGTSSSKSSMVAIDIPLDTRIPVDDPRLGWTNYLEEEDKGMATDEAMRNRGYMRGVYSYADHAERDDIGNNQVGDNTERNMRYTTTSNQSLRKILGRFDFKQSDEHWLRIKYLSGDWTDKWQLDYVEFVPIDVVDNDTYKEDWY